MQYTSVEQLLMDDSFLAWYYHIGDAHVEKWDRWITASEENRRLADEAVAFIISLGEISVENIRTEYVKSIWGRIEHYTADQPVPKKIIIKPRRSNPLMLVRNYYKVGIRNLVRNKVYSFINITGLSIGMAVAMLIGLWIIDECAYNKYYAHYDRIVQIWQRDTVNNEIYSYPSTPVPLAAELRRRFPSDFKYVSAASNMQFFMTAGDNTFIERGTALEPEAADMLSLQMIAGDRKGLQDPNSIFLSATTARKLYGNTDPIGKALRLSNTYTVRVAGVYQDPPYNTDFKDISFVCPWQFFMHNWDWIRNLKDNWSSNCIDVLAQLNPNIDLDQLNRKIADTRARLYKEPGVKTGLFLYPMSRWHLYGEFNHGLEAGGLIVYIRMFSIIGIFVLLLACINFMNLSTARSERRAREVGIRKTMGSARSQLIFQFFTESILMSVLALFIALFLVFLALPGFNRIADKHLSIPSISPAFWLACIGFALFTGLIAGSYPAIYLSSFQPVKVLKGTFRAGRFATIPRKVLVVLQFSVSISLIIGTFVIFRQIGYARSRPVGYERTGLISIQERTTEIYKNYDAIHHDLLQKGLVVEMSESQCPVTDIWANEGGFQWTGKSPSLQASFAVVGVRHEFGKTLGWQFVQGRDFDKNLATDSTGLILNETAVRYMGLKDPVGMTIRWNKLDCKILGVVKDLVMASPYQPVPQTIFYILHEGGNIINIRLNPRLPIHEALAGTEAVFKKWDPSAPFDYHFTNEEYAKKFSYEIRIGTLASVFASLAILISCLGLFGLSSFLAEQRTREIGVRKVLGATIYNIWQLLSKDFVWLVVISLLIATPLAWYGMHAWLQQYAYRTELSWWIFAATGLAALLITLMTVSFQALRAALANPVRSLRTE